MAEEIKEIKEENPVTHVWEVKRISTKDDLAFRKEVELRRGALDPKTSHEIDRASFTPQAAALMKGQLHG